MRSKAVADKGDLDGFYESMRWLIDEFLSAIKERDRKILVLAEALEEIAGMRVTDYDAYDTAEAMKQLAKECLDESTEYQNERKIL